MSTSPGSASIRSAAGLWNKSQVESYLLIASIGVLAGAVVAYARTPLHLPGHKAIYWITPILVTRLFTRRSVGATVGALSTVITTLLLGGRLAGGVAATPLVIFAGVVLDIGAHLVEQRPAAPSRVVVWRGVLILAAAGTGANLICFIKRLFEPVGTFFSTANLHDLATAAGWHALFGLIAGLLAAAIVLARIRSRRGTSVD